MITLRQPGEIVHLRARDATWTLGVRTGLPPIFRTRDLGFAALTGGLASLAHVRAESAVVGFESSWHMHRASVQVLYVIGGTMRLGQPDGSDLTFTAGDAGSASSRHWHYHHGMTADYEMVEFVAPAGHQVTESPAGRPSLDPEVDLARTWRLSLPTDPYEADPRGSGWEQRSLGLQPVGASRLDVRILRRARARPGRLPGDGLRSQALIVVNGSGWLRNVDTGDAHPLEMADVLYLDEAAAAANELAESTTGFTVLQIAEI